MTLPNFLIIGAAKAGTTSLRRYLAQHPEIYMANRGEPSFFAHLAGLPKAVGMGDNEWNFVTDLDEYRALFEEASDEAAIGEISPRYLYFPESAKAIKSHIPNAKIIAVLRDPVDRAYSHFLMNRQRGVEPAETLTSAFEREEERTNVGWGWDWRYQGLGLYNQQLRRYYDLFSPDQICILKYEDYQGSKERFFRRLFSFLEVDNQFVPDTAVKFREAIDVKSPRLRRLTSRNGPLSGLRSWVPKSLQKQIVAKVSSWNHRTVTALSANEKIELFSKYFAEDQQGLTDLMKQQLDGVG